MLEKCTKSALNIVEKRKMWHTDIRKASKRKGEEVKTDVRETYRAGNPGFFEK